MGEVGIQSFPDSNNSRYPRKVSMALCLSKWLLLYGPMVSQDIT